MASGVAPIAALAALLLVSAYSGLLCVGDWATLRRSSSRPAALIWCAPPFVAGLGTLFLMLGSGWDYVGATAASIAVVGAVNIVVTDLRTGLIADLASAGILAAGMVNAVSTAGVNGIVESLAAAALAGGILVLAWLFVRARSGRIGLGSGDVFLAVAAGSWVSLPNVGPALLVAVVLTALAGLALSVRSNTRMPFGPGLVAGFLTVAIWEAVT
ncbi:prepilin peptidase [Maricaulis sp. CAU 1757]